MWQRIIYHPEVNYALRQTLVLCLPVAIGWLAGDLQKGLLFSLVPACCNIAGLDTLHKRFFKRLLVGGSLFALCSFLIQWLNLQGVPLLVILPALTLLIGVTGEISPLHARLMPASLIAGIFTLSLLPAHKPLWVAPALYIGGTFWYGLFNWCWFRLWKEQPMRETLSLLYRELADYCDVKYSQLMHFSDQEKYLPPLLTRQQKIADLITLCYQQMHMLVVGHNHSYKRLIRTFQIALDLQEHIFVSFYQPLEVQKLLEKSLAGPVIRWNARTISARLRVLADAILYHQLPTRFTMQRPLLALEKIARQQNDNPVGSFCCYHFGHIAHVLRTQRPLYQRDLMADRQRRLPLLPALKNYLSLKSSALRTAARFAVMLMFGSLLTTVFNFEKPWWILMTILLVCQNNYRATRVRIQHRALGTFIGLVISALTLRFAIPQSATLLFMLLVLLFSYLFIRKTYGLATIGFTVIAVYSLQLITLNGGQFLLPRLLDTLIGCLIAFGGTLWLWPQWQSGLLRQNAHDALGCYQDALRMLLSDQPSVAKLACQRIQVNLAHNTLFSSLNEAMQEPAFDARYLADMKLWVMHSQLIVEHINALTIMVRDHIILPQPLAQHYLQSCEIALQRCQQRLEYDGESSQGLLFESADTLQHDSPQPRVENHLKRILAHLNSMYTLSSLTWRQRPRHGQWLVSRLRQPNR